MKTEPKRDEEVELGFHSWMDCLVAELFFNCCFLSPISPDSVFVTLFREAVEIAGCGVYKLFRTSEVPTSLTLDFIVLTVVGDLLGLYRSGRRLAECCFTSIETVDLSLIHI